MVRGYGVGWDEAEAEPRPSPIELARTFCASCGTKIEKRSNTKFCASCGASVTPRTLKNQCRCGISFEPHDSFCIKCGAERPWHADRLVLPPPEARKEREPKGGDRKARKPS